MSDNLNKGIANSDIIGEIIDIKKENKEIILILKIKIKSDVFEPFKCSSLNLEGNYLT